MPGHDLPTNERGKFYHIDCGPGDIAPYILTCADPGRAEKIARFFHESERRGRNREYVVYTGTFNGVPVSAMGTGIGPSATAIAVVEAAQCQPNATFIRIGTCGAVQPGIENGDLIITERVIRDESTTYFYDDSEHEVRSDPQVLAALVHAAKDRNVRYHVGATCTSGDFYAGQGRVVPGFPTVDPHKIERLRAAGVLNCEMEMSVYLTLARVSEYNLRAGGVTVALCNRIEDTFVSADRIAEYETRCIETGLRAVEILYRTNTNS